MIPSDAIDPDVAYEQWVRRFLWHVDQLPAVVEKSATIVLAVRGLRAAPLHEKVGGGGYIDNIMVADGPESRDARAVWDATRAYIACASGHIGVEGPALPPVLPDDSDLARGWAYAANEWLSAIVEYIRVWPDLEKLEDALFRLIDRARGRTPGAETVRRAEPDMCEVCGERAVLVDWASDREGNPTLVRACTRCGETYTEVEDNAERSQDDAQQ